MGFAVIGYPTKRSTHRLMEDQLPSKLRSKKDNKKYKREVELKIKKEKELRRKVEREKARRLRLKQMAITPEERARIEAKKQKQLEKLKIIQEKLRIREEAKEKARIKAQKLALIKERKADFKRRNIPRLTVIMDKHVTDEVQNRKYLPIAHYGIYGIRQWTPKELNNEKYLELQKKTISSNESTIKNINSIETEVKKRSREHNEDVEAGNLPKLKNHKKSKKDKKAKKDKKKKKKDKKQKKSKNRPVEELVNPQYNEVEKENHSDDMDTIIDPNFNMETIQPVKSAPLSVSPSKKKQNKIENKLPSELSLSNLPPEVIQKVFVFSFANYNMLLTNKYLNHCLTLSDHLLERNLYENYLFTIDEQAKEDDHENRDTLTKKYLNVSLFKDPVMTKYFIRKFNNVKKLFNNFITDKVLADGIESYSLPSLPHVFYLDYIHSFFDNPKFLKYIFLKFEIHVDTLVDHIISWFFTQTHYKIDDFLKVMDNIKEYCQELDYLKEKINFTAHHLVTILECLFLGKEDNPSNHIEFFHGISSIVDDFSTLSLMELKIKFVDIYLLTFYKFPSPENETTDSDINVILDDSLLWSCLRKISNIELLDMFVARGVRPSYGEII